MKYTDAVLKTVTIGFAGENERLAVRFDVKQYTDEYPSCVISLVYRRPGDASAYPVTLTVEGGAAVWVVSSADTESEGVGEAQLIIKSGDVIVKSAIYKIIVNRSVESSATVPEAWVPWVTELSDIKAEAVQAKTEACSAAESAAESRQSAADSARTARLSALAAETARAGAESAIIHAPKISEANSHWLIWDADESAYTDTGISAVGATGAQGAPGDDGVSVVGAEVNASGHLIITLSSGSVIDAGAVASGGEVDVAMSGTSENAVQNKVIKAYVDAVKSGIEAAITGGAW